MDANDIGKDVYFIDTLTSRIHKVRILYLIPPEGEIQKVRGKLILPNNKLSLGEFIYSINYIYFTEVEAQQELENIKKERILKLTQRYK